MADGSLSSWVASWNPERVLHLTLSVGTFLVVLRREVRESWGPWRRKRWCGARRRWCLANPEKMWPVPEKFREWARWGAEHKMYELSEYTSGELEVWLPAPDRPLATFLD